MIDSAMFADSPELLVYGMLSALLAAGVWLLFATRAGLPVSTTHSIVGAIVGFAAVTMGIDAVQWGKIGTIAISWIVSPVLAGTIAYFLYRSVQLLILDSKSPFENSKRYVPFYIFLTGFIISLVTVFKGLKHLGLDMTRAECYGIATIIGVISAVIGVFMTRRIKAVSYTHLTLPTKRTV